MGRGRRQRSIHLSIHPHGNALKLYILCSIPPAESHVSCDRKEEVPSKSEKGTKGIDGRVAAPKSKDLSAFVITLGRAGEDNKSFQIRDTESTFAGFAGADYRLQDAIQSANSIEKSTRGANGTTFYEFDIDSPDFRYLTSIAVKDGKVFALFVRSPSRQFQKEEAKLRKMISTFTLL